ncbi:hypothetical protein AVMA1855_05600 [Acidovorax sp. SUPP1855]|uniref:Fic family protein n=1 Tax=Acidovorax sp. SUPP1855 TaxID=431774 RepID=UPI0023DE431E|nr:Fic family protein [Acidovorax sp. SUPP1855]GKS83594.1 hypothetical protein AVMA1855_05600 [Acidovorax sp. SUPP1855]
MLREEALRLQRSGYCATPSSAAAFLDSMPKGSAYQDLQGPALGRYMGALAEDVDALASHSRLGMPMARACASDAMMSAVAYGSIGTQLSLSDRSTLLHTLYGMREAARAQEELKPCLQGVPAFRGMAAQEAWRMVLDHAAWTEGPAAGLRYENEPGYMGGMLDGLRKMLVHQRQGRELDTEMLVDLHDACTAGVFRRGALDQNVHDVDDIPSFKPLAASPTRVEGQLPSGLRHCEDVEFHLDADVGNVSSEGLKELLKNERAMPADQRNGLWLVDRNDRSERHRLTAAHQWHPGTYLVRLATPALDRSDNAEKASLILREYRTDVAKASSEKEKLRAIARCAQRLEQAHLFMDGNARTTGFLVVNKLLLENGLAPTLIADPNHFDGLSANELAKDIQRGQTLFKRYCVAAS